MDKPCSIECCNKRAARVGMCGMHYMRKMRHGDPGHLVQPKGLSLRDRFDRAVVIKNGCWDWSRKVDACGYTRVFYGGKWLVGSRASWELHRGAIPAGLHVCHKCDNRRCTNPEHLFLGTIADNNADKVAKGRQYRKHGPVCLRSDCANKSRKIGLCTKHYNAQYHASRRLSD